MTKIFDYCHSLQYTRTIWRFPTGRSYNARHILGVAGYPCTISMQTIKYMLAFTLASFGCNDEFDRLTDTWAVQENQYQYHYIENSTTHIKFPCFEFTLQKKMRYHTPIDGVIRSIFYTQFGEPFLFNGNYPVAWWSSHVETYIHTYEPQGRAQYFIISVILWYRLQSTKRSLYKNVITSTSLIALIMQICPYCI